MLSSQVENARTRTSVSDTPSELDYTTSVLSDAAGEESESDDGIGDGNTTGTRRIEGNTNASRAEGE